MRQNLGKGTLTVETETAYMRYKRVLEEIADGEYFKKHNPGLWETRSG